MNTWSKMGEQLRYSMSLMSPLWKKNFWLCPEVINE